MTEKECRVCHTTKPLTEYYTRNSKHGYYHTCKDCYKDRVNRRWSPERQRDYDLRRHYGISAEEYDVLLNAQDGVCKICDAEPTTKRLAVDHNHETGEVRGLLCETCNRAIGMFKDNPEVIRAAANYLEDRGYYG